MSYHQLRNRADLLEVVLEEVSKSDIVGNIGDASADHKADTPSLFESFLLSEVKAKSERDGP